MSSRRHVWTVSATLIVSGFLPTLAQAQAGPPEVGPTRVDPVQAIKDSAIVNIPLLLEDADASGAGGSLWAKGDQPGNNLLARLTARPVQVAVMQADSAVLWRAMPGDKDTPAHSGWVNLKDGARIFCGPVAPRTSACWIDSDGNGEFDQIARALTERGDKPYHITIIAGPRKLDAPKPYRILPDDERPKIPIEVRNCDKDYDRPRFSALSTTDRNTPVSYGGWLEKDSNFAVCRRGSQIAPSGANAAQVPEGGYLAQIGPLTFAVGPKKNPTLQLIGLNDPGALYRLESASLVRMAVGPTPMQAQLIARQQFPYPVLVTEPGATIHEGTLSAGQVLATIPFHHAYRGRLTQDVTINTLLSKRSVSAGTVVYGFPGRMQLSLSRGGVPMSMQTNDSEYRDAGMDLIWCAPVQGQAPAKEDLRGVGRNGWSAACIPHGRLGTHTVLTDLQPAFEVSGVVYDVNTSSNDGRPPIERDDKAEFGAPLRMIYVYDGLDGKDIRLLRQIYFGDSLTSLSVVKITPAGRLASAEIAGGKADFSITDDAELVVKQASAPVAGIAAGLKWDQSEQLRAQLKKMGLKLPSPEGGE